MLTRDVFAALTLCFKLWSLLSRSNKEVKERRGESVFHTQTSNRVSGRSVALALHFKLTASHMSFCFFVLF